MMPHENLNMAVACMQLIQDHKDDETFDKVAAQTLAQCAQAQALIGILQVLLGSSLYAS